MEIDRNDFLKLLEKLDSFEYESEKLKHTTIREYQKMHKIDFDLTTVYKECGMDGKFSEFHNIVCNENTIMTYSTFLERENTFCVNCIYTKPSKRNNNSCKNLLKSLKFNSSLYFDTYSESLVKVVNDLGGFEEEILKGKLSTQLILNV